MNGEKKFPPSFILSVFTNDGAQSVESDASAQNGSVGELKK